MKKQINEIKRMQLLAGIITESEYRKSLVNEEMEDIKVGGTYIASMPISSDRKERIDIKVKILGKDRSNEDEFVVTPLEDKDYTNPVSKQLNRFEKGKHYGVETKYLKPAGANESLDIESLVNELSTGGLDTKVLYNFIEKHGTTFSGTDTSELESVKGKELFLDDLLTTQDGLNMLSGKLPKFAEALKKYNIKLNLNKANIEHPNDVAKIYDALIKPGIISLDDLKNVPNIVTSMDAKSANWSDEVINKLKDQNHINAARILKGAAIK